MFQSQSPVAHAIEMFNEAGLCVHDRLHEYHCRCDECTYDRPDGFLLAAQTDPTVGAEFITRIMRNNRNKDLHDMRVLERVYGEVLDATNWWPDGVQNNGNHIHVGWPNGLSHRDHAKATSLLQGMFNAELDLWEHTIATGGASQVRPYNRRPTQDGYGAWGGSWLGGNPGTIEFRMWNTPVDPDRLLVHPALSISMLHWALQVVDEEGDIHAFETAATAAAWSAERARPSRKRIAKIVKDLWPDTRSARLAAELIAA
jgi:hypothetical protein